MVGYCGSGDVQCCSHCVLKPLVTNPIYPSEITGVFFLSEDRQN